MLMHVNSFWLLCHVSEQLRLETLINDVVFEIEASSLQGSPKALIRSAKGNQKVLRRPQDGL